MLDGITEFESLWYSELEARLEMRFGEGHLSRTFYTQFTNRKQKFEEDLSILGANLERLAHLAYPECSLEVREKITCAQFIAALFNGFLKQIFYLADRRFDIFEGCYREGYGREGDSGK